MTETECMYVCMYVLQYMPTEVREGQRRTPSPFELEIQVVVNLHVIAGIQTWVFSTVDLALQLTILKFKFLLIADNFLKLTNELDLVLNVCSPSSQEREAGVPRVGEQPGATQQDPAFSKRENQPANKPHQNLRMARHFLQNSPNNLSLCPIRDSNLI